ncbi:hypothetical protein M7I_3277 [Glarea lozoyensis 74030]|uniref:Uncharacterized protein n=1 Tax=Glarea lozoyensis (strain ATCC 74030 / MF5533) TaxID=1104152 RepID=H0EL41_GLAL7|nr:hypothetical protein M7I_3277 [Glarea lozoyensis 74030]
MSQTQHMPVPRQFKPIDRQNEGFYERQRVERSGKTVQIEGGGQSCLCFLQE